MKIVERTRYICDHCGRGHWRRKAAAEHERTCFANPARECRHCAEFGFTPKAPEELAKAGGLDDPDDDGRPWPNESLAKLREECNGCPGCMFAAAKHAGVRLDIDFQESVDAFRYFQREKQRPDELPF